MQMQTETTPRLRRMVVVVALVATTLYGCADNTGRKETGGTLIGMALGGFLGAQFGAGSGKFVAAALGAVAGGLLGNKIGRNLDENDRLEKRRALSVWDIHVDLVTGCLPQI